MMKRTSLALLSFMVFAVPAQALSLIVWDSDFKKKVAYGESIAGKFNVKFDKNYSGPVIVLFSQNEEEKDRGTYAGLRSSYEGTLRGSQLLIDGDGVPNASSRSAAGNDKSFIPLKKLLQPYKLSVDVQPTSLLLPPANSMMMLSR